MRTLLVSVLFSIFGVADVGGQADADFTSYIVGIVHKGPRWVEGESVLRIHHNIHLDRMESAGSLLADGTTIGGDDIVGILFFRDEEMLGIQDMMASDPAVRAEYIRVVLHRWYAQRGLAEELKANPDLRWKDDEEYQLVFVLKGPEPDEEANREGAEIQNAHIENINRLMEIGMLALGGPVQGDDALQGLMVLRMRSVEDAHRVMEQDPAIRTGRLSAHVVSLRLPAGVIP